MAHSQADIVNALTIDVEEYFHATIFREATRALPVQAFESRAVGAMDRLLRLMAEHHVLATFFVLGSVASAHPALVKKIASLGHEIACHGYDHDLVSALNPLQFRADVGKAKHLLEDLISGPVIGYRAPSFSIPVSASWAYEILAGLGFTYDSSVYPINHDRYGDPSAPRIGYTVYPGPPRPLFEVPIGTLRLAGINLPIGGGGYFRLLPWRFIRWAIRRVNRRDNIPVVFYLHPWELDPDQPRPPMPLHHRFRHYVGLRRMERKLSHLIGSTRFAAIRDVFGADVTSPHTARTAAQAGPGVSGPNRP